MENSNNTQHELYLQEIEGIDDYWGSTFRMIYDNDHHTEFREILKNRIKHHDKDIERLCNVYYQGFIDSIRELLDVRLHANKLKTQISDIDDQLQKSAKNISKSSMALLQARKIEHNIETVIAQMNLCLPVLLSYTKLKKQISVKRYYPALKTLEELEHLHLPNVAGYRFSTQLRESIPKLRESIENASMSDLKDFLENIRNFSPKVGEMAMKHTSEHLATDPTVIGRKKKRVVNYDDVECHSTEEELSAQDLIDFSPIYRGIHIATVLNTRSAFESYYRAERTKQVRLVLQPPTNMHESGENYRKYMHSILGFFILENHVLNTGNGLITSAFLDEMWTLARSKLVTVLQTHSAYSTDAALILHIKDLIMLFCTTLRNYGYTVKLLWDLVRELRDHYTEVLMQRWVQEFREILSPTQHDDTSTSLGFQCITVHNFEEYEAVMMQFPYDENDDQDNGELIFPYKFPFSDMVPKVYQQVKEFIYACLKFSEDLNWSIVEVDEMIRKSMNLLLTRTFNGCLSSTFHNPQMSLPEIIQIIIDTGYLELATVYLDQFISNITGEESGISAMPSTCQQPVMFRVAREEAVSQICEKLKYKLKEFFDLQCYDWLLSEPTGHASSYITDLIKFLQTTFSSFTNLPPNVAQIACKSACEYISKAMFDLLLNNELKQISMGALNQVNLDLLQCEQFAASEPIEGLQPDDLLVYFENLREILDLFTSWDWPTYFHDYGHENSRYKTVQPSIAIILLEKLKEGDKKTMFSVLKKSERDKKKLLETVLKQLRQLLQIPTTK